jgi:hypothetical protein
MGVGLLALAATFGPAAVARPAAGVDGPAASLRVVKVEGPALGYNYWLSPLVRMLAPQGEHTVAVLAGDGDLLVFSPTVKEEGFGMLRYQAADGEALALDLKPGRAVLGGKTVSVFLHEAAGWEWLQSAPASEKKDLRLVVVPGKVEAARLGLLKDLARQRPKVGLWLEVLRETAPPEPKPEPPDAKAEPAPPKTETTAPKPEPSKPEMADAVKQVLPLFRPDFLAIDEPGLLKGGLGILAALQDVETLIVSGEERGPDGAAAIGRAPRVRRLLLPAWPFGKDKLPPNLRGLRSLRLMKTEGLADLAPLADLKDLEDLHLMMGKGAKDLAPLGGLKKLRRLSLFTDEEVAVDLAALKGVPLEYFSFPQEVSQAAFDAAVKDQPGLQAVELFKCKNVKDLGGLKGLKDLKALVLLPPNDIEGLSLDALAGLKPLRLLVLDKDLMAKSAEQVAQVKKDLPEVLVEPGKGICLGSGLILLMVPAAAGMWALRALRRRRRPPGSMLEAVSQPPLP